MKYKGDTIDKRLKNLAEKENRSKKDTINMLIDVYEIQDIDSLIKQISKKYRQGLPFSTINKLRLLVSYLKTIIEKIEQI
jgi:hypothetical protein